jgi:YidC/Oxa1 family membrane protein insertase
MTHLWLAELQKVREKFQAERFTNPNANQEYITHTRDVMKKHDVKLTRSLRPMLIQLPVFVSMFLAFRHLSETAPQALQDGGMLWFTNLAVPDPFWGLPLCTAATFLATIEVRNCNSCCHDGTSF